MNNKNYNSIDKIIGKTPLVKLQRLNPNPSNAILLKLEGNNPAGSVKDRAALSMISQAEKRGEIKPGRIPLVDLPRRRRRRRRRSRPRAVDCRTRRPSLVARRCALFPLQAEPKLSPRPGACHRRTRARLVRSLFQSVYPHGAVRCTIGQPSRSSCRVWSSGTNCFKNKKVIKSDRP